MNTKTLILSALLIASLVGCGKAQLDAPVEPPAQEVEQVAAPDTTTEESAPADNSTVPPEVPEAEATPDTPIEETSPAPSEPASTETTITPDTPVETPAEDDTSSTTENTTSDTEEPVPSASGSSDSSSNSSSENANSDTSSDSDKSSSSAGTANPAPSETTTTEYKSIVDKVSDPNSPYFDPYDDNFDPDYVEGYSYDWGTSKYWPIEVSDGPLYIEDEYSSHFTESEATSSVAPNYSDDYVVDWTDQVIERAARKALGKPNGSIKRSELDSIAALFFNCGSDSSVVNVSDFRHFHNLEKLAILYADGTDFSKMPKLERLSSLEISMCHNITGLSSLSSLSNLTSLDLYATDYTDFAFLSEMTNLTHLDIARTGITDLSPLKNLTKLTSLKIYGNECDAAVIAHLVNLQEVTVSNEVKNNGLLKFVPGYSSLNAGM